MASKLASTTISQSRLSRANCCCGSARCFDEPEPRRLAASETTVVRFGRFAFSLERGELRAGDDPVRITEREREMLRLLERKRRRDRFSRGAVGIGRRRPGANGRRPRQSAAAQDRTRPCQSDILADGARSGISARRGPMSERLRIPQAALAGADPHALAAGGARPGGDAAEGPLQALAPDRDRADGAAPERGDARLHAASLGSGDPQALRGGGA